MNTASFFHLPRWQRRRNVGFSPIWGNDGIVIRRGWRRREDVKELRRILCQIITARAYLSIAEHEIVSVDHIVFSGGAVERERRSEDDTARER